MKVRASVSAEKPFVCETPRLVTRDDFALGAALYKPKGPALGTVIVHGATAAPSRFYGRFAEYLAHHGMRVLTYDYRGIGASRPGALRGFRARMSDWALLDAAAAHRMVHEQFPGEPVATIGHSFGGQLLGLLDAAHEVHGSVLVASQLGYYGHWDALDRFKLGFVWHALVPTLTASFGYLPGEMGLGEDLPRGVAEQWARWCKHPEYLMSDYPEARERFARFDKPMLFYSFDDDEIAPRRAVAALIERLSGAQLEHHAISPKAFGNEPIGHFGFFRPRFEQTLWLEAVRFLTAVLVTPTARA